MRKNNAAFLSHLSRIFSYFPESFPSWWWENKDVIGVYFTWGGVLKCPCVQRRWNWTFDCGFPFWWSDILIRGAFSSPERLSKPCRSVASGSQTREGAQVRKSRRISCPQRSSWHGFPWQWLHLLHGWWRCSLYLLKDVASRNLCVLFWFCPKDWQEWGRIEVIKSWVHGSLLLLLFGPNHARWRDREVSPEPLQGHLGRGSWPQSSKPSRSVLHFIPPTGIVFSRDKCRVVCQV